MYIDFSDVLKKIPLNLQKKKSLIVTENCHEVFYELHFKILEIENQKDEKITGSFKRKCSSIKSC